MGIIEYIYIRIYDAYKKKKDPARFSASLYMSCIMVLLLSPIAIFCAELFRMEGENIDSVILLIYAILILIWIFSLFNKDRIQKLKKKRLIDNKYKMPTWCLFMILPISFIWAIFMYWIILSYIILPYHLEGIVMK